MAEPTSTAPDLDAFCLLDRLGLTVTGQHVAADHMVLRCRLSSPMTPLSVRGGVTVAACGASPVTPLCVGWRTCRSIGFGHGLFVGSTFYHQWSWRPWK